VDRELETLVDVLSPLSVVGAVHAQHIGEENRVEFSALESLSEIHPRLEVVEFHLSRPWRPPRSEGPEGHSVLDERIQDQSALGHSTAFLDFSFIWSLLPVEV
jgi:hypothetical protein